MRFWYTPALVRNVPTLTHEPDVGHETELSSLRPEPWSGLNATAQTLAESVSISARLDASVDVVADGHAGTR